MPLCTVIKPKKKTKKKNKNKNKKKRRENTPVTANYDKFHEQIS